MKTRAERAPETQLQVTAVVSEHQGSKLLPALCNRTAWVSVFCQQYNYYPRPADRPVSKPWTYCVQRLPLGVHMQGHSGRKSTFFEVIVSVIGSKKFIRTCLILNVYWATDVWIWRAVRLFLVSDALDVCLWDRMKSEVYKRKVDTRGELLGRILDAAARINKREDQLRQTTCDLRTHYEIFKFLLSTVKNLSFLCNKCHRNIKLKLKLN
jgi:hypothetical protein